LGRFSPSKAEKTRKGDLSGLVISAHSKTANVWGPRWYGVAARLSQTTGVIKRVPAFDLACPSVPHIERELGWPRMDRQSTAFSRNLSP